MKLPWDAKYIKISFHVVLTLIVVYILMSVVDLITFVLLDLHSILSSVIGFLGTVIRIFSPLILAFVIAYLFDPLVDFYQKKFEEFYIKYLKNHKINIFKNKQTAQFKKRLAGTTLTYITVFLALYILIWSLIQNLDFTGGGIMVFVNTTIETFMSLFNDLQVTLADLGYLDGIITEIIDGFALWISSYFLSFVNDAVNIIAGAGTWLLNFFIALVVAFFFMNNKEQLKQQIDKLAILFLPPKTNNFLSIAIEDFHFVFSGYIRGLILDGIILGTLIAIFLSFIGVELAVLIGVLTAIFNLIPFFGGIIAFFLSVSFELLLGEPTRALLAGIIIIVIQQIDTMLIVPKVIGQRVKLAAPVVMLSLTIAGTLFGMWGMLLVVPSIAIAKIFFMRFMERYAAKKNKL